MKTHRLLPLALAAIILATLLSLVLLRTDHPSVEEVTELISRELPKGATTQDIEAFFQRREIAYDHDRYKGQYHGIIRDVSVLPFVDKAIEIELRLDTDQRLDSIDVYSSFTFL
jgi:hypothetical protein